MTTHHENIKTTETLTGNPNLVADSGLDTPPNNPLDLLRRWFDTAIQLRVCEPYGITLATVDSGGCPSTRVVLLKDFDERGLFFATSETSNKGKDLVGNPWAACTLWWRETVQQINCQGSVHKLSEVDSDEMFKERVTAARAIASVSKQSAPLSDEAALRNQVDSLIATHTEIQRPKSWHGYVLELSSIEFWHGSADRFHKRLLYDLVDGHWNHQRLQP